MLLQLWCRWQLQCGCNHWPGNFHIPLLQLKKKKKEKKKKFFNSDIHLLGPISPQYISNFVICKFLFLIRSKKEKYREENSHLLFFSTGRMGLELWGLFWTAYSCCWALSFIYFFIPVPFIFYFILFFKIFLFFFFAIVDLQCSVNFCCTAKWPSHTHTHTYIYTLFLTLSSIMFHYKWLDIVPCAYCKISLLIHSKCKSGHSLLCFLPTASALT